MSVTQRIVRATPDWITPNRLSQFRIFAGPIVLAAYLVYPVLGFTIYVLACLSDLFDGVLAREKNQMTLEGKQLDEQADKHLAVWIAFLFALLIGTGKVDFHLSTVFLLVVVATLFRDVLITWLRRLRPLRAATMPSLRAAKWKTAAFMVGSALVILGSLDPSGFWPWIANVGTMTVIGAMGLAFYSGYEYVVYLFLR